MGLKRVPAEPQVSRGLAGTVEGDEAVDEPGVLEDRLDDLAGPVGSRHPRSLAAGNDGLVGSATVKTYAGRPADLPLHVPSRVREAARPAVGVARGGVAWTRAVTVTLPHPILVHTENRCAGRKWERRMRAWPSSSGTSAAGWAGEEVAADVPEVAAIRAAGRAHRTPSAPTARCSAAGC
jgi:hypothetical protein